MVQKEPTISLPKLQNSLSFAGVGVSTSTLSRRLKKELGLNFKSYKPAKKPRITSEMAKKRLEFAKRFLNYSKDDWDKVMYESTIEQFGFRTKTVRRPANQRINPRYIVQAMKHPGKQMIWASMSSKGIGGLHFLTPGTTMNGKVYLDMLKEKLQVHMELHNAQILMHDGAPCHRSKIVSEWLQSNEIQVLPWPGNSPDCNPIENVWNILKNEVAQMRPTSISQLNTCIKTVWKTKISSEFCKSLVHSMPRRLAAVIANKGYQTKY